MTYEEFEQLMEEFNLTTTKNFRWAGYLIEKNKLGQKVATGIAGFRPPLHKPDEEHPWKENAVIVFDQGLFMVILLLMLNTVELSLKSV